MAASDDGSGPFGPCIRWFRGRGKFWGFFQKDFIRLSFSTCVREYYQYRIRQLKIQEARC